MITFSGGSASKWCFGLRPSAFARVTRLELDIVGHVTPHQPTSIPGRWRLLAAFALLPMFDALLGFVLFPVMWELGGHGGFRPADPDQGPRIFAVISGLSGLLVTLCGAIPVVFWLIRRGPVTLRQLLVAGLALGNAPFAVYVLVLIIPSTLLHLASGTLSEHLIPVSGLLAGVLRVMALGSTEGLLSAVVFWFVAILGTDATRPSPAPDSSPVQP
jgi:hypothetical protein